ncbi:MAG: hypothetical protein AAGI30_04610 [Planctomycetota bacterium]
MRTSGHPGPVITPQVNMLLEAHLLRELWCVCCASRIGSAAPRSIGDDLGLPELTGEEKTGHALVTVRECPRAWVMHHGSNGVLAFSEEFSDLE